MLKKQPGRMMYMPSNNTCAYKYRKQGYDMGFLISPAGFRKPVVQKTLLPFAMDNGMYFPPTSEPKGDKELSLFYEVLCKYLRYDFNPMFVVVPDRPYDAAKTRSMAREHASTIRSVGYSGPLALAVQDGMTPDDADEYDVIFVGGSTDWKWGTISSWGEYSKATNKWLHVARVNTKRRIQDAAMAGADSCDGTGIFRGDQAQLTGVLSALEPFKLKEDKDD